jgi:hypothetical protein
MMASLLKSIGPGPLTAYFEYLDTRQTSVAPLLWFMRDHPGMARAEAVVVVAAWRDTLNEVLPVEDRVDNALQGEAA